ncbi:MAG TPA: hypothetical protein VFU97_21560 [Xanthobacteraceae bacterium]|jgi:hypothetical protein|nr:hypothetical protein [Xanthobacteraceae bacterium]
MTALVTATVLRWEVKGEPAAVHFVNSTPIKMVVGDGASSADVTPVIAEYILKAKESDQKKLLEAARDGLLQVTEMSRVPLTKPAVPPKL